MWRESKHSPDPRAAARLSRGKTKAERRIWPAIGRGGCTPRGRVIRTSRGYLASRVAFNIHEPTERTYGQLRWRNTRKYSNAYISYVRQLKYVRETEMSATIRYVQQEDAEIASAKSENNSIYVSLANMKRDGARELIHSPQYGIKKKYPFIVEC